ncbi:MAG: hypothetical protein BalsKO_00240 [Balneolaceae bacterium]
MRRQLLTLFILTTVLFTACSDSDSEDPTFTGEFETATNFQSGLNGSFTFFDLNSNAAVTDSNSTTWDLAFTDDGRGGLQILTNSGTSGPGNGGAIVLDVDINTITEVPSDDQFTVDTGTTLAITSTPDVTGSWFVYTGQTSEPNFAVLPKDPHTILIRTGEGDYAKIEIVSYYEGNPDTSTPEFASLMTRPAGGYYTFNFEVLD